MRKTLTLIAALALAAPAAAQTRPNRFVTVDNETWGYVQLIGDAVTFSTVMTDSGPGAGFRPGLAITILTRGGRPVTEADRNDAWFAANEVCLASGRRMLVRTNGILLRRGGILFGGACE